MTKDIRRCFPESSHIFVFGILKRTSKGNCDSLPLLQICGHRYIRRRRSFTLSRRCRIRPKNSKSSKENTKSNPGIFKVQRNCIENLKIFVWEPRNNKAVPINWTNNAYESMDNISKLSTNWKTYKLPDLVDKLHKIVRLSAVPYVVKANMSLLLGHRNSKWTILCGIVKSTWIRGFLCMYYYYYYYWR